MTTLNKYLKPLGCQSLGDNLVTSYIKLQIIPVTFPHREVWKLTSLLKIESQA